MKNSLPVLMFCVVLGFLSCEKRATENNSPQVREMPKALVFSKTNGYRHESIAAGKAMLIGNSAKWNIQIDTTEDATAFNHANLRNYRLIILLSNTGNNLSLSQRQALQSFVVKGGRILGIHSASDAEYDWEWYGKMIGARFSGHPPIQEATCEVKMPSHSSVKDIILWTRADEWYNYTGLQDDNQVVLIVREDSYAGGTHGESHPISWYREFEGGRVFYTAMGHTSESYSEPRFIQHIEGAIQWLLDE